MRKIKIKHKSILLLGLSGFLLAVACDISSFKKDNVEVEYHFDSLRVLNVKNDVTVHLIQDSLNFIKIIAPDKMQNSLSPEIYGDTIKLINYNGGNLINKYQYNLIAEIHFTNISYLFHQGGGNVFNTDTIRQESFKLATNGANGDVNLLVKIRNISVGLSTGSCVAKFRGECDNISIWTTSYCKIDFLELKSDNVSIRNNSSIDAYISVGSKLVSKAQYIGNVFYNGNPDNLEIEDTGEGKTMKLK